MNFGFGTFAAAPFAYIEAPAGSGPTSFVGPLPNRSRLLRSNLITGLTA